MASCHTHASAIYTAGDARIFSLKINNKGNKRRTAAQRPATISSEPYPEYERANWFVAMGDKIKSCSEGTARRAGRERVTDHQGKRGGRGKGGMRKGRTGWALYKVTGSSRLKTVTLG